jgi:transposase
VQSQTHKNHNKGEFKQMKDSQTKKLMAIEAGTLVVGVDIAKQVHWARFVDYRGMELGKAHKFNNTIGGFKSIVEKAEKIKRTSKLSKVIIGMEPTGNYWKPFANFLIANGIKVVTVGTYQTKMAKALDDNSPTKNDPKDALTIAKLVKDGRYSEVYMPNDIYAELRVLGSLRGQLNDKLYAVKNRMHNIIDEYFPEITSVFKNPFKGKAALQMLKSCPFPAQLIALGTEGVLAEIKKAVKKTVGRKKAQEIVDAAKRSVGVSYGMTAALLKLSKHIEEFELLMRHLEETERAMEQALAETGFSETVLGIKGIGIVSAANIFGEVGDFKRFENERQIHRLAGYNLTENSSGNSKSKTSISKRGRKRLRSVLFQSAMVMVSKNSEMKEFYEYLKSRKLNPLKRKQALIVVAKKIITIIYKLVTKGVRYDSKLVFNNYRSTQIKETLKMAA